MGHTWAERIAREIMREECRLIGYVCFGCLEARLAAYLDEGEQARFIAEAKALVPDAGVESLLDAFLFCLPADVLLILTEDGFTVHVDDRARLRLDVEASIAAVTKRLN
jgi:hypothetical protein